MQQAHAARLPGYRIRYKWMFILVKEFSSVSVSHTVLRSEGTVKTSYSEEI